MLLKRYYAVAAKGSSKARTAQNAAASAKKKAQKQKVEGKEIVSQKDTRYDIIQRILYPEPTSSSSKHISLPPSIPPFVHSTILRAYQLHLRHERESRQAELERKWRKQREAMISLEQDVGGKIFKTALSKEKGGFLFPTSGFHIPTETPPTIPWNYEWKSSKV